MTKAVYAQFMKGLTHPEPRRSFERMRRTIYKRKAQAGKRQLTRDNLGLRQELQKAHQTIINLQQQVMQLTTDLQNMVPYIQGGPNGGQNYEQNYGGHPYH